MFLQQEFVVPFKERKYACREAVQRIKAHGNAGIGSGWALCSVAMTMGVEERSGESFVHGFSNLSNWSHLMEGTLRG